MSNMASLFALTAPFCTLLGPYSATRFFPCCSCTPFLAEVDNEGARRAPVLPCNTVSPSLWIFDGLTYAYHFLQRTRRLCGTPERPKLPCPMTATPSSKTHQHVTMLSCDAEVHSLTQIARYVAVKVTLGAQEESRAILCRCPLGEGVAGQR